jgi:hypothetical protein
VCFSETVKVILFTLTVYAITVKKREIVREFQVSNSVSPKGVWVEKSWFSERCLKLWVSFPSLEDSLWKPSPSFSCYKACFLWRFLVVFGGRCFDGFVGVVLFWWWFVVAFVSVDFLLYLALSLSIYARHALVVGF